MRKHHNKLYYGRYPCKVIFKMPQANLLWPTTDQHLHEIIEKNPNPVHVDALIDLSNFILENRNKMKFRIQEKQKTIFYCDKEMEQKLIAKFGKYYKGSKNVDPRFVKFNKNTVGCKKLPHGKYQYQIYLKKDAHKHITTTQRDNLKDFIERNIDHCYVPGYAIMDYLEDKCPYCFGGYFYVTTERFITPVYMMVQEGIDKVIRFRKVTDAGNKKIKR